MATPVRNLGHDELVAALFAFIEKVAATGYDGRPCSHEDGCHASNGEDDPESVACLLGVHCDDWDVGGDEEHDNLFALVSEARGLLGLPDLLGAE